MKRLITIALCGAMMFSMAACSVSAESPATDAKTSAEDQAVNDGVKPEHGETVTETEMTVSETEATVQTEITGDKVVFTTTDREGKVYDNSIFADHGLTIINFWEPWCGPCVGEIPDIEKLYENYKDEGLLVIGVYSETTMEDEVDMILQSSNVTYPVLTYSTDFDKYKSGYVPTTILVDRNGNIIDLGESSDGMDSTLIVGARTYSEWEALVNKYLGN